MASVLLACATAFAASTAEALPASNLVRVNAAVSRATLRSAFEGNPGLIAAHIDIVRGYIADKSKEGCLQIVFRRLEVSRRSLNAAPGASE